MFHMTGLNALDQWALRVHVILGVIAVVVAPAAMIVTKGGWWHRLWGRIFVGSMFVVLSMAVPLSYYRNDFFLFCMTIFVFYLTLSGWRIHARKRRNYRGSVFDWVGALATVFASIVLIRMGLGSWGIGGADMGLVISVFGVQLMALAATDIHQFLRPPKDKRAWWYDHMGKMLGAYLGALTAVSVVQFQWLPVVTRWLWPSAIGIPGIVIWIAYYKYKFRRMERRAVDAGRGARHLRQVA